MWTHGFTRPPKTWKDRTMVWFYSLAHGLLLMVTLDDASPWPRASILTVSTSSTIRWIMITRRLCGSRSQMRIVEFCETHCSRIQTILYSFSWAVDRAKRIDMLIEACRQLKENGTPTQVLLIGTGPAERGTRQQASDAGISDRIVFFGESYAEDALAPLIYLSDVCVAPGQVGLTAIHTMGHPALP